MCVYMCVFVNTPAVGIFDSSFINYNSLVFTKNCDFQTTLHIIVITPSNAVQIGHNYVVFC